MVQENSQAADLISCCGHPAFVHFDLAKAVGENGGFFADDPSWLSRLARGQSRASCTRDLTLFVQTSSVAFQKFPVGPRSRV